LTLRLDLPPASRRGTILPKADILPQVRRELSLGAVRGVHASRRATPERDSAGSRDSRNRTRTMGSRFADRLTLHPEDNVAEHQREPEFGRVGSCR